LRALGLLLALLCVAPLASAADDDGPLPEVATALSRIRDGSNIEITTIGRKSGKPHAKPIWYVVDGGRVFVQSGKDGKTDWYRNLQKTPAVSLKADHYTFRAHGRTVTDPKEVERVHALFRDKYTSARLLSWVGSGIGQGLPVELAIDSVSVAH
jgi:deazaflavin-dependent oxidoreductase (nitroreductase family)